jgi:hypothetical protein
MRVIRNLRRLPPRIAGMVLAALVLSSSAASQTPAPGPGSASGGDPEPTVVLFTLEGRLGEGAVDASLPAPLVDRLAAEPAMARLDVDNRTGSGPHPTVTVNFVFESTAAYRAWYASAPARALIRELTAVLLDPRRHLRIQRRSSTGWFGN